MSDTVGFIRDLPTGLVAAFRARSKAGATDLLLHVVGAASTARECRSGRCRFLRIGAEKIPQLLAWNKIDLAGDAPGVERDEYGKIFRVRVSARTLSGLAELRGALAEFARGCPGAARSQEFHPQTETQTEPMDSVCR